MKIAMVRVLMKKMIWMTIDNKNGNGRDSDVENDNGRQ